MNFIKRYAKIWLWPALVIIVHNFATAFGTYYSILWFDSPMHLFGGAAIGTSSWFFLKQFDALPKQWWLKILIIAGITALTAVCWEFLELVVDAVINTHTQLGLKDTLKDLYFGIVGGTIAATIAIKKTRKN
ncbi:MAG: hypothetical protein M3Q64_01330 [bacterium]|nr:hypothetical protein [bacterium]